MGIRNFSLLESLKAKPRPVNVEKFRPTVCTITLRAQTNLVNKNSAIKASDRRKIQTDDSGRTDLIVKSEMQFHEALAACHNYPGQRFFQDRTEHRLAVLTPSYRLALEIVRGGESAFDLATSRMPAGLRHRAFSRDKPELVAVQITAKPQTLNQRKQCSALASLLMVARVKGLSTEAFPGWAADADLEECRTKAKRIRAALRAGVTPDLDDENDLEQEADAPWVQISYGRGGKALEIYSVPLPMVAENSVAALIGAGVAVGTMPTVLRRAAALIDGIVGADQEGAEPPEVGKVLPVSAPVQTPRPVRRPISPRDVLRDVDDPIPF